MKSMHLSCEPAVKPNKEPKLSRAHAPVDLSPADWQRGLRRQFGREQSFVLENLGSEPFFSEFYLRNAGQRRVHFRAGTDCPPAVRMAADRLFDMKRDGILADDRLGELKRFMTLVSGSGHEFRAYDDALDFIAGRQDADRRASKLERLFPRHAADLKLR